MGGESSPMRESKYFVNQIVLQNQNSLDDASSMKVTTKPQYHVFRTGNQGIAKYENLNSSNSLDAEKYETPELMSMTIIMNYQLLISRYEIKLAMLNVPVP